MDIAAAVGRAIHFSICNFDPEDQGSYNICNRELNQVESQLTGETSAAALPLLADIGAERIRIAYEAGKFELVLEQSAAFLQRFPPAMPGYFGVASLRMQALHEAAEHELEIQEALKLAKNPELTGSEYVYLIAALAKRHPCSLPVDDLLWKKLVQASKALQIQEFGLATQASGDNPEQLEEKAAAIADELYRRNRARGDEILS